MNDTGEGIVLALPAFPPSFLPPGKRILPVPVPAPAAVCHCCSAEPPSVELDYLPSQWRVALLCPPCLAAIASASVCSFCYSPFTSPDSFDCRLCRCRFHLDCIPLHRRRPPRSGSFTCIDCYPYIRPHIACASEEAVMDATDGAVPERDHDQDSDYPVDAAVLENWGSCNGKIGSSCTSVSGEPSERDAEHDSSGSPEAERLGGLSRYAVKYCRKRQRLNGVVETEVCRMTQWQ